MMRRKRCANCGAILKLTSDLHYIATEVDKTQPLSPILQTLIYMDAYDCQVCGRQYLAGIRAPSRKEDAE